MNRFALIALIVTQLVAAPLHAQELQPVTTDPTNDKFANLVGTVPLTGRSISFLVTHQLDDTKFTHGYLLFSGAPGTGNLGVDNGAWRYSIKGNFLVRARRHFTEPGVLTVVIDAPSDRQKNFTYAFRASPRHGEDIRAATSAVEKHFGALDWTFIGTSEGTVTATHAARMLGDVAKRLVLTASLVDGAAKNERPLAEADVAKVAVPVLWVHHEHDPCWATRYDTVKALAGRLKQPLITVAGQEDPSGPPCEARSQHGFVGREIATIRAIRAWVKSGAVAQRVDTP